MRKAPPLCFLKKRPPSTSNFYNFLPYCQPGYIEPSILTVLLFAMARVVKKKFSLQSAFASVGALPFYTHSDLLANGMCCLDIMQIVTQD